jgi:hypothetical protein
VAEWSKALAWKVSMGQKLIQGSNPCRSATGLLQGILKAARGFGRSLLVKGATQLIKAEEYSVRIVETGNDLAFAEIISDAELE